MIMASEYKKIRRLLSVLSKISEQEDFKDQYELGLFYLQGKVVFQDYDMRKWLIGSPNQL